MGKGKIRYTLNRLILLVCVTVGTAVIAQQAYLYLPVGQSLVKLKQHKKQHSDNPGDHLDTGTTAIVTTPGVNVHHEYYQIKEIVFDDDPSIGWIHDDRPQPKSSYRQTLFRRVISPNAP